MSRVNPRLRKHAEEFQVSELRFLGEQDGLPERELKFRLAQLFTSSQSVITAYLARVVYPIESHAVALCLRSKFGAELRLIEEVGTIFSSTFATHAHLDIIFLDAHH